MARVEIESLSELEMHLAYSPSLDGVAFQNLDLTQAIDLLREASLRDCILIGCKVNTQVLDLFVNPIMLPPLPDLPFNPFRAKLYTPEELLGGYEIGRPDSYHDTVDWRSYVHYKRGGGANSMDVYTMLARRLHDHAITDALQEFLVGRKVVAIMGGHSMLRSDPLYLEVARLSRDLVHAGYLPASGGGPGAMEATHVGAWFAERPDEELVDAVNMLSVAPLYKPQHAWLDAAFRVMEKYPVTSETACQSIGIPTWLYGHEPPTGFALSIAKYFANSVREEGLLAIAHYGVVFAPGSAGTIQEIFQDAAQNHYKTFGHASPMVFLNTDYWTHTKPVYPTLQKLAKGREYGDWLSISDDRQEILNTINRFATTLP